MAKRFEYRRLTTTELSDALAALDLPPAAFCRIFGVRPETMEKWMQNATEIPPWVHVALVLLAMPGALVEARRAAAQHIERDLKFPQRGAYPYLNREEDSE